MFLIFKAPCCEKFYVCRLCHDDLENHELDRFKVAEVQCAKCKTVQQVQRSCESCATVFGDYYCSICHLYDIDKKQYHCSACGICRIGPKEMFFHCSKCNFCLAIHLRGNHKCVENVSRQNCPVCLEDIHTSRIEAQVLPCGHLLHNTCRQLLFNKGAYRCPLCMQSAVDMTKYWEELDAEIAETPMPTEYHGMTVRVLCNDCHHHSIAPFHVLGMKCIDCGSYNTAQDGGLVAPQQQEQQQ
uniref:Ring finger and CHY zinc finger domain containing 1 n=1 Tax=Callorhinchus milii TaxID=7868 RepID=A0A4W3J0U8_CALMI